jgi:hypothetical protein
MPVTETASGVPIHSGSVKYGEKPDSQSVEEASKNSKKSSKKQTTSTGSPSSSKPTPVGTPTYVKPMTEEDAQDTQNSMEDTASYAVNASASPNPEKRHDPVQVGPTPEEKTEESRRTMLREKARKEEADNKAKAEAKEKAKKDQEKQQKRDARKQAVKEKADSVKRAIKQNIANRVERGSYALSEAGGKIVESAKDQAKAYVNKLDKLPEPAVLAMLKVAAALGGTVSYANYYSLIEMLKRDYKQVVEWMVTDFDISVTSGLTARYFNNVAYQFRATHCAMFTLEQKRKILGEEWYQNNRYKEVQRIIVYGIRNYNADALLKLMNDQGFCYDKPLIAMPPMISSNMEEDLINMIPFGTSFITPSKKYKIDAANSVINNHLTKILENAQTIKAASPDAAITEAAHGIIDHVTSLLAISDSYDSSIGSTSESGCKIFDVYDALEEEIKKIRSDVNDMNKLYTGVRRGDTFLKIEAKVTEIKGKLYNVEDAIATINRDASSLTSSLGGASDSLSRINAELPSLRSEIQALKVLITALRNRLIAEGGGTANTGTGTSGLDSDGVVTELENAATQLKLDVYAIGFEPTHPVTKELEIAIRSMVLQEEKLRLSIANLLVDTTRSAGTSGSFNTAIMQQVSDPVIIPNPIVDELSIEEAIDVLYADLDTLETILRKIRKATGRLKSDFEQLQAHNAPPTGADAFDEEALSAAGLDSVGLKIMPGGFGDNGCDEWGKNYRIHNFEVDVMFPEKKAKCGLYYETYPVTNDHVKLFNRMLDMAPKPKDEYRLVHELIRKRLRDNIVIYNPILKILSDLVGDLLDASGIGAILNLLNRKEEAIYQTVKYLVAEGIMAE